MPIDINIRKSILLQEKVMLKVLKSLQFNKPLPQLLTELQQAVRAYLREHKPKAPSPHDIVLVGGGSGSAVVGRALLEAGIHDFALVANVADTLRDKTTRQPVGAGILKLEYGIPDVVDITKQLLHATPAKARTELNQFLELKPTESMRIGYLVLAALYRELGDLQMAIQTLSEALGNTFDVVAVTTDITELYLSDAKSEEFLDLYTFAQGSDGPPAKITLQPPTKLSPGADKLLRMSKYIIIGPGDLHFSVLPHFLVQGFQQALSEARARVIIVTNLTTREVDTPNFTLKRLLDVYSRYLPKGLSCDAVVNINTATLPYELEDDLNGETYGQFQIHRSDVVSTKTNNNQQYVHDETKLGDVLINQFLRGQR